MEIGNIERVMAQIVHNNEKRSGPIKFKVGEVEIENKIFTQSNGFLPLLIVVSQSLEMMMGKKKWSEEIFEIKEDEDAYLNKQVVLKEDASTDTPINTVLMSLSAATDILLDKDKNPYIKMSDNSEFREVDLVAMLADMNKISVATTSKALSISPEALSRLYEEEDKEMINKASL